MIIGFYFNAFYYNHFRHFYLFILYMKIKDFKLEDYMEGYKFVVTIPEGTKYIEKHRIQFPHQTIPTGQGEYSLTTKKEYKIIIIKYNDRDGDKLVEYKKAFTKESSLIFLNKFKFSENKEKFIEIDNVQGQPQFTYYEYDSENITIEVIDDLLNDFKLVTRNVQKNRSTQKNQ